MQQSPLKKVTSLSFNLFYPTISLQSIFQLLSQFIECECGWVMKGEEVTVGCGLLLMTKSIESNTKIKCDDESLLPTKVSITSVLKKLS